ncbi:MAG: alkaline phosphatase family protein, partial [bacterium]
MNKFSKLNGLLLKIVLISTILNCGCDKSRATAINKNVVVIGFDGMDHQLLSKYMEEGRLPNLSRLAHEGDYKLLGTSVPPQSPVAWSNFITGMNPGGHGIFDFIHRDLETMFPISSTSKTEGASRTITIGNWVIPLSSGKVQLLRQGKAFWTILEDQGIPTTIFRVPSNFPPVRSKGKSLSGMGTPDLLGTYGTFSFYTDKPPPNRDDISGGVVYPVQVTNNQIESKLVGPKNTFRKHAPDATIPFKVWIDPEYPTTKIVVQDHQILLQEGEWSDWIQVNFDIVPLFQSVTGICRFYLKEVRPNFELYVTPINIDPSNPALPISTPEDYSKEFQHGCG